MDTTCRDRRLLRQRAVCLRRLAGGLGEKLVAPVGARREAGWAYQQGATGVLDAFVEGVLGAELLLEGDELLRALHEGDEEQPPEDLRDSAKLGAAGASDSAFESETGGVALAARSAQEDRGWSPVSH